MELAQKITTIILDKYLYNAVKNEVTHIANGRPRKINSDTALMFKVEDKEYKTSINRALTLLYPDYDFLLTKGELYKFEKISKTIDIDGVIYKRAKSVDMIVSCKGEIYSISHKTGIYKLAPISKNDGGYYKFHGSRKYSGLYVHRIVADAWLDTFFLTQDPLNITIDHIDKDKANNSPDNL